MSFQPPTETTAGSATPDDKPGAGGTVRLCMLASGSRGNAIYVSDQTTSILVDAGLSAVEIKRRLAVHHIDPDSITAVVLTHEHLDHVRGIGPFCRRHKVPLYATGPTMAQAETVLGRIETSHRLEAGRVLPIGPFDVCPFPTSHDACDPVGLTLSAHGVKVGIATDLGVATSMVAHHLKSCHALVVEANHDLTMLHEGPYPWHLKQRVRGRQGHLCNEAARDLVGELLCDELAWVVLGHLSQKNNLPEKALGVVAEALKGHRARLVAACQDTCGQMICLAVPGPAKAHESACFP